MSKVALVTAGSKGMGAACVRELAERGYDVAAMARSEAIHTVTSEIGGLGFQGSVLSGDDLAAFVDAAMEKYGRIDAVVNNTGHPPKGDLLEISDADWHTGMDFVLMNVVRVARLVVPHMEANGGGAFVNISTFGAVEPSLKFPVSSALRAALSSFTTLFAERYAAENIRMNSVLPGFIDSFDVSDEIRAQIPMGREGTVAEVAKTVAFLLSDDAAYITGQNLVIDGGLTKSL